MFSMRGIDSAANSRVMSTFAHNRIFDKRSPLRILAGIYLFLLFFISFSLSVPPADLPLCGLMFVLAAIGVVLSRLESPGWRIFWIAALIIALASGVLEFVAGKRLERQHSEHAVTLSNAPL